MKYELLLEKFGLESILDKLNKLLTFIKKNNLYFGNLIVGYKNQIIFLGSHGTTNSLKNDKEINIDTIFELASVSKQFTAKATLIAFEKFGLSIDSNIEIFIRDFPYPGISVRNLLNHTSGIPDYIQIFQKKWNKYKVASNKDVLEYFIKFKPELKFSSNTDWEYSNTGYVILASLIEIISGLPFAEFLNINIFNPFGMKNTHLSNDVSSKNSIQNFAFGKVFDRNKNTFVYPENLIEYEYVTFLDGIQGDGGVQASASDLLKWNHEIIKLYYTGDSLCNLMFTKNTIFNKIEVDYGLGWFINIDKDIGKTVYHGGSWPGYSTYNSIFLDQGISIVYLCNQTKNIEVEQRIILEVENILFKNELSNEFT